MRAVPAPASSALSLLAAPEASLQAPGEAGGAVGDTRGRALGADHHDLRFAAQALLDSRRRLGCLPLCGRTQAMLVPLLDAEAGRRYLAQVLLEEGGLGLERHESQAARHESTDDGDELRESLGGGALRDVDADEAQAVLDDRVPGDAHEGAFRRVVLVGGLGGHARESGEGLGGAADPQHDAEKHGEHTECIVVSVSAVREGARPSRTGRRAFA